MTGLSESEETRCRAFSSKPKPMISYGLRFPEACAREIVRLGCSKVHVLASSSLANNTQCLDALKAQIGNKLARIHVGVGSHTSTSRCVEIATACKDDGVDCLITLGGGSVTDAGKLVRFAIANEAYTDEDLNSLWGGKTYNPARRPNEDIGSPTIPLICVPTSLSGGEYQPLAGATEPISHVKRAFETRESPNLVIQDPELCLSTPDWLWLSSGVRAVDHCVETLCSLQSNDEADRKAADGLHLLAKGLIWSKNEPNHTAARHLCQQGVVASMAASSLGVPKGASHAIGHQLGPFGVGHGETSCILLPAVCKYNAAKGANTLRQEIAKELLFGDDAIRGLLQKYDLVDPDLGDVLDALVQELGLPRSLHKVGITRDKFDAIAINSLEDIWSKTNPVPITEKSQVLEILEMCV